jgi:hypothetical protein
VATQLWVPGDALKTSLELMGHRQALTSTAVQVLFLLRRLFDSRTKAPSFSEDTDPQSSALDRRRRPRSRARYRQDGCLCEARRGRETIEKLFAPSRRLAPVAFDLPQTLTTKQSDGKIAPVPRIDPIWARIGPTYMGINHTLKVFSPFLLINPTPAVGGHHPTALKCARSPRLRCIEIRSRSEAAMR